VRGRSSTVIWKRYCGTAAKAGGNGENKHLPAVMGVSCLLENDGIMGSGKMWQWFIGKIFLKSNSINEKISLKSTFQYSIFPLFHVRGINIVPRKNALPQIVVQFPRRLINGVISLTIGLYFLYKKNQ
jgi:hypothetical protein